MTTPNTIPLTWNGFAQQICTMMVVQYTTTGGIVVGVDAETNVVLPQALQYAELRIQRDLDLGQLLTTRSYTATAGSQTLTLPANDFVTVDTVTVNNGSSTTPLLPVAREFIQNVYGDGSQGVPAYFAFGGGDLATGGSTTLTLLLAPSPAGNYTLSVMGTIRMPSLYSFANTGQAATSTNWISTYLPDLLIQAAMIYIAEYQRNFSAVSNDPQMPGIYEQQYKTLLAGAKAESSRLRLEASAWTAKSAPVNAAPGR